MAVLSKDKLLESVKEKFKDDTSDETLALIENVSDTLEDLNKQVSDSGEWKAKYEENDREWREKYKERFFSKPEEPVNDIPQTETTTETEDDKPRTFEDLFKTE